MTQKETPDKTMYGFGWALNMDGSYDHGGSFNTSMRINPKLGLITIFLNQSTGKMLKGAEKAKPTFEMVAKKLAPAPTPPLSR